MRIGEAGAVIKGQADSAGASGNGKNAVRRAFCGTVTDYEEVVIVIDELVGGRQSLAEHFAHCTDQRLVPRIELADEASELLIRA